MEYSCRKCAPKASPRPLFNFWEITQNSHCMQEILLEIRYYLLLYIIITLFFPMNQVPFKGQSYQEQKYLC